MVRLAPADDAHALIGGALALAGEPTATTNWRQRSPPHGHLRPIGAPGSFPAYREGWKLWRDDVRVCWSRAI